MHPGREAPPTPSAAWLDRFRRHSEMGERTAAHDWASSPLGAPEQWSTGLRTAVAICLGSRFPMMIVWGPALTKLYNDGYAPMLGQDKHPRALGAPAREIWPEVWDEIGPMFDEVRSTGVATWAEHQRLDVERNGFLEECYFTFSYSPLPDDDGTIGGVLNTVTETTEQVVNGRRVTCLSELNAALVTSRQVTDVCARVVAVLARHGADVRSAEAHLRVGEDLVLVAATHRDPVDVTAADAVRRVADVGVPTLLDEDWSPGHPAERYALPIGDAEAGGVLVVVLNPRRPFDDGYRAFVELLAANVGIALENTFRRSVELGEQRHISDTLQSAMLVPASDIPTVAARYLPAVGNLAVGGDWYDVISLPDGRRALVVGDCVGHGLGAATAMGQLRSASRALLLEGHSPARVLEAMDRFAASVPGASSTTMACVVVDVDRLELTYSTAGHPPALVVGPAGTTWLDDARGLPLAVVDQPRPEATLAVAYGDLLVLYTDGLVERRHLPIDDGLERLAATARDLLAHPVAEVADGLIHDLLDPEGRDDVALVVKRLAPHT